MIKVLIADDQELIRQSLSIILCLKEEISVVGGVGDGTEVLEFIAKEKPDIILMDIGMPVVDGYQATDAIRQLSSDIPIVAVTAFAYDEDRRKVMSRGFNGYLSKPLNKDELLKMLHKMGI